MTCLAWTHQGLKLLTGSQDKTVICQNIQVGPTVQVCTVACLLARALPCAVSRFCSCVGRAKAQAAGQV